MGDTPFLAKQRENLERLTAKQAEAEVAAEPASKKTKKKSKKKTTG